MTGDLMFQNQIRDVVRTTYSGLPAGAGRAMAARLYDDEQLAGLPDDAIDWFLGVGNPVRRADLRPGEVVVDLGCGGGIDTILAAHEVGSSGRAIGVDTLDEMCERTRGAAAKSGVDGRCEVLHGEMESLPLSDESVDVVISNGVVNLSPRKSRALAEAFRVLRPGGRFCVADLTVDDELPSEVLSSGAVWAGCIAGALSEDTLTGKLQRAGFDGVRLSERIPFSIDDCAMYPLFTEDVLALMRRLVAEPAQAAIATSLIAKAVKPGL